MHDSFSMKFSNSQSQPTTGVRYRRVVTFGVGLTGRMNEGGLTTVRNILYLVIQEVRILVYAYGKLSFAHKISAFHYLCDTSQVK